MATYPPPNYTEPLPIFNPANWEGSSTDTVIDIAYLNANYLKFPVAQGLETLQAITVNGVADFNNTVEMGKPLNFNGALATDRVISNCETINGIEVGNGFPATPTTNTNIVLGVNLLNTTTTGSGANVAIGEAIGQSITTGNFNNLIGKFAGRDLTSGQGNQAMGSSAIQNITTGQFNVAIGNRAGEKLSTGNYNVLIGSQARENGTAGDDNTAIGNGAGLNDTGSFNSYLGAVSSVGGGVSNSTVIGYGATTSTANTIQLGRTSENVNCPNTLTVANTTTITTNYPASSTPSLTVRDSSTGNALSVIPNVGNSYNPSADVNNIMVLGTGTQNAETLHLTNWSATNTYVKVRPTSVGIGAGGTSNTATTSVECNGTTVRITPSITFPDNSVQTTAFTGGASTTYTIQYTTTQSITLPANCIGIGVRCIGQGGTAGVSSDGNAGTWGAGGSGGGGGTCYSMGIIPLYAGTVIQLNFAGYTEILLTTFSSASLCRANAGGNGSNGSGSNGGAGGAGGSSSNLNTTYGDWSTKIGSVGQTGGSNLSFQNYAQIPSTAGSPVGIIFSDTNFGCGQRWGSAGGINAPTNPPITKPTGVCYITYYLKN